ncbi:MAG: DUF4012 domain-containing protein [Candidatus Yanofskybacteria bacterium]|nr:DUF4012 domain-containing protein [Candidatus Yanofskybacteria bacterium]
MPKRNILLAMFDVRPIGKSASLVLGQIKQELNLRVKKSLNEEVKKPKTVIEKPAVPDDYWEELIARLPQRHEKKKKYELTTFSKGAILEELEKTISEPVDVMVELARIGGRVYKIGDARSRTKIASRKKTDNWTSVGVEPKLIVDAYQHSPASREIEIWLENLQKNREAMSPPSPPKFFDLPRKIAPSVPVKKLRRAKWSSWFRFNRKAMMYFGAMAISGSAVFGLVRHQGIWARNNIIQNGNNAVANFENAKQELEGFNFVKAADSFALAYDDLNKASGTLNQLGASFLSVFGNLPGLNKVKAASNLVGAGQSLSKAGENLSLAFGTLYKTNLLSFLDTKSGSSAGSVSISKLLTEFKDILIFADKNIKNADNMLADIDASAIPTDKQELFLDFKEKIPEFKKYISEAVDYSDFLLKFVGSNSTKTYLVLLQNNSELRPTGGFPGTYGLITFENGSLKKIFVEDVYRADANLKENIMPPIPLQHITPNWGMRDAAWFADFPFSARKVMEFYKLDGGPEVDGVLTITPDVIAKVFDVIGPIEMPEYGLTLNAGNFLAEIQNEVEYEADRSAPKQILTDLQPKFFERLARQDKDQWLAIFKIISESAEQKHMLAYFKNSDLEKVAIKNGLAGEMKQQAGDYLQVVFSNVKGSKTDFVTENSMDFEAGIGDGGTLNHNLTINRVHNGGDSKYGFYNRDNSAYIKVYVPTGSVLEGIQGQSITDFSPLIGHGDFGFKKDPELAQVEESMTRPVAGVDVFEESGKTVFGFWLITKPKQTKSVTLKYRTPVSAVGGEYNLLWQKQSGTGHDRIAFSLKLPEGKNVINQSPRLQAMGDSLVLNSDLSVDREIDIDFR